MWMIFAAACVTCMTTARLKFERKVTKAQQHDAEMVAKDAFNQAS